MSGTGITGDEEPSKQRSRLVGTAQQAKQAHAACRPGRLEQADFMQARAAHADQAVTDHNSRLLVGSAAPVFPRTRLKS